MPLRKSPNWLRASFFRWCVSPSLACWLAMHSGKERLQDTGQGVGMGQGVAAGHGSGGKLEGTGQGVWFRKSHGPAGSLGRMGLQWRAWGQQPGGRGGCWGLLGAAVGLQSSGGRRAC